MNWLRGRKRTIHENAVNVGRAWLETKGRREDDEDHQRRKRRQVHEACITNVTGGLLACMNGACEVSPALKQVVLGGGEERDSWKRERAQNNFTELFGERTTGDMFKRRVRMTRESFEALLQLVSDDLAPSQFARGDFMSPRRTLALTLLRLAHGTGFLELSESFAIGLATAHGCYKRGIAAICKLQEQFIREPSTVADVQQLIDTFSDRGFPNACLAVDGCHVKVELTDQYHGLQDFICYKGFYSLNNIAYVDGKGFFRAVLCGWAGASADGGVVKEMHFTKRLQVSSGVRGFRSWRSC